MRRTTKTLPERWPTLTEVRADVAATLDASAMALGRARRLREAAMHVRDPTRTDRRRERMQRTRRAAETPPPASTVAEP